MTLVCKVLHNLSGVSSGSRHLVDNHQEEHSESTPIVSQLTNAWIKEVSSIGGANLAVLELSAS